MKLSSRRKSAARTSPSWPASEARRSASGWISPSSVCALLCRSHKYIGV